MVAKSVPYLSASQIDKFAFCPILYYYDYVVGGKRLPPNIYMIYGTAIHEALAFNFRQKIVSRVDLGWEAVHEKFTEAFEREIDDARLIRDPTYHVMKVQAEGNVFNYMTKMAPSLMPKLVEHTFEIKLKNYPVTIKGIFDLVTEDDYIIDFKTAGKSWKDTYRQTKVEESIQLRLYCIAFRKLYGRREKEAQFHIIPRYEEEIHIRKTCPSEESILKLLKTASAIEQIVKLGVFMPNLTNCSKCDLNSVCPKQPWVEQAGGFLYLPT